MKNIIKFKNRVTSSILGALALIAILSLSSCDPTLDTLSYDLPDANSKADLTPPSASFSASVTEDYLTWTFGNTSASATDYVWDYGNGNSSTGVDGESTYPTEGTYTVTLTASDKLGATSTTSMDIVVVEPPIPAAINPMPILNGDFTDGGGSWKWSAFTGGTKDAFNSSSDGSNLNYDGSDNGGKTPGAKWTNGTSSGIYRSSKSRFAGRNLTVSPGREYILEYEYAIKNDNDTNGGAKIVGEILDGHFTDGADALASSDAGPIVRNEGVNLLGKGNFTLVRQQFTASDSGLVSIFIWAETQQDSYVDNVKVYPID